MSENLQRRIDGAVKDLSAQAYEVALKQISDNREAIDRIVEVLMEKETITGNEFRSVQGVAFRGPRIACAACPRAFQRPRCRSQQRAALGPC